MEWHIVTIFFVSVMIQYMSFILIFSFDGSISCHFSSTRFFVLTLSIILSITFFCARVLFLRIFDLSPPFQVAKMEVMKNVEFNSIMQDESKGMPRYYTYGVPFFNYGLLPQTWEDPSLKVHRMLYTIPYTLYTVHHTLYTLHYTIPYTLYTTPYVTHCTLDTRHASNTVVIVRMPQVHGISWIPDIYLYTVHRTLYTVDCTLYTLHTIDSNSSYVTSTWDFMDPGYIHYTLYTIRYTL